MSRVVSRMVNPGCPSRIESKITSFWQRPEVYTVQTGPIECDLHWLQSCFTSQEAYKVAVQKSFTWAAAQRFCSRFSSCFVCRTREIQITSQAIWTIAHTGSVLIFSFMSTGSCLLVVVECWCVWWFWINQSFNWFTKVATWLLVSSAGDFMGTRLEESVTYKEAITTSETLNSCCVFGNWIMCDKSSLKGYVLVQIRA